MIRGGRSRPPIRARRAAHPISADGRPWGLRSLPIGVLSWLEMDELSSPQTLQGSIPRAASPSDFMAPALSFPGSLVMLGEASPSSRWPPQMPMATTTSMQGARLNSPSCVHARCNHVRNAR